LKDWNSLEINQRFLYILLYSLIFILILLPFLLSFDMLATLFVLVLLLVLSFLIGFLLVSKCYNEVIFQLFDTSKSIIAKNSIQNFIEQNKKFLVQSNTTETSAEKYLFSFCSTVSTGLMEDYYLGEFIHRRLNQSGEEFCKNQMSHLRSNLSILLMNFANWLGSNVGW
jgi:hypothetical protein